MNIRLPSRITRYCLLATLLCPALVSAQTGSNPLLVSTEERCAINRVDDESLALAIEACEAAATSGDLQAQFEMGELYYRGERVEKDVEQALNWFEQASVQGHPAAQYQLGLMHYQGEGVTRNLPQAYIILKMAAVNGKDEAMDASDQVALQMNADELDVATQVLGTLFRNYLAQIREEQLKGTPALSPNNEPRDPQLDSTFGPVQSLD
ncbi:tetratricopeptide repeat protein [Halopseudomonas pelagia]|uniref:tetratricopeptide repeat protein n=1 Tax=Halopseudomonas pelagia TaxID=553151 RepID=UPI0003A02C52|nr:tetratricopeptide repeat protein [Halopseudomonas pelagia]|tara:strand:+ start:677 stop:1303 length:627 start_codon:yes stop_codon:yes gene_type:complete